jgi:hypothetical protein
MKTTRKARFVGAAAAAAIAVIGLSPGVASADPQKGDLLTLSCEGGLEVDAVVFSNGRWSPALDTGSNAVYRPIAFEDEYFVVRDAETGEVLFEEQSDGAVKNGNRLGQDPVRCEYLSEFSGFDEFLGIEIEGQASGVVYVVST